MFYMCCPGWIGLPGYTTDNETMAREWAQRQAKLSHTNYTLWRIEAGIPRKIGLFRGGARETAPVHTHEGDQP
jgi:hypothetical protein